VEHSKSRTTTQPRARTSRSGTENDPVFLAWFGKPLPDSWQNTGKEFLHRASDFNRVRLERECPVSKNRISARNIAFVGLGTSRQKERIIATHTASSGGSYYEVG